MQLLGCSSYFLNVTVLSKIKVQLSLTLIMVPEIRINFPFLSLYFVDARLSFKFPSMAVGISLESSNKLPLDEFTSTCGLRVCKDGGPCVYIY